jgi:voltage-gated potassium channel
MMLMLGGTAMVSIVTATVSSMFVATKIREGKGLESITYREHTVICGWSHITRQLLETLATLHTKKPLKVVLVGEIPGSVADELLSDYASLKLKYVRGDWTNEAVLKHAHLAQARMMIILPDDQLGDAVKMDEKTIMATLTAKGMNPKLRLIALIQRYGNRVFLQQARADEIIVSDELNGFILASHVISSGVPQLVREMLSAESENKLVGHVIPSEYVGRTFADLSSYFFGVGKILIGMTREEDPLETTDLLSADTSALDDFIRAKFTEAGMSTADKARTRVRLNPPRDTIIHARDMAIVIGGGVS